MYLKNFNYLRPKSLSEACETLQNTKNGAVIAGGTDLLVEMKMGRRHQDNIISLAEINEIKNIEKNDVYVEIGAGVTHSEIANSKLIKQDLDALSVASLGVGTEQIRNAATIGGNICTAASCCDTAPVLLATNSKLEVVSNEGSREIDIKDFFVFHRKTALKENEILTKIKIPKLKNETGIAFEKYGLRNAATISVATAVTLITIENGICIDAKIVIGSVAPIPLLSKKASEVLIGKKIEDLIKDSDVVELAAKTAVADARPLTDIRGSKEYRKELVKVLVRRTIKKAAQKASL